MKTRIIAATAAVAVALAGCSSPGTWKPDGSATAPNQVPAGGAKTQAAKPPAAPTKLEYSQLGSGPSALLKDGSGIVVDTSIKAKPGAKVVTVHFDFQCPYCLKFEQANAQMFNELNKSGDIVLVHAIRSFLDGSHKNKASSAAAAAAVCAAQTGKYEAAPTTIFAGLAQTGYPEDFFTKTLPTNLKISDPGGYAKCLADPATAKIVAQMEAAGSGSGVNGTPAVLVNGQPVELTQAMLQNPEALKTLLTK